MSRVKHILTPAIILLLIIGATGCKQSPKGGDSRPPLARCMEDLKNIPELAALKGRDSEAAEGANGRPLEGLEIALTINGMIRSQPGPDDIDNWCEHQDSGENFEKMLAALKQHQLPPTVAFAAGATLDPKHAQAWVASGNRLGSLNYSLKKSNKSTADDFIADLARNEQAISPYLSATSTAAPPRYFRFPRLKLSFDADARARIDQYLRDNHYTVVPVTIDARDEQFNWIYCSALSRQDDSCVQLLKAYFRSLLLDTTLKARKSADEMAGHPVKQILYVKANQFTCDVLAEMLAWYKSLGARFIPLDEALRDPFYTMIDGEGKPVSAGFSRALKHAQSESGQKK